MMDWTDRHCRRFHRALTGRALLYSEMVTAPAVIHGNRERLLGFDAAEHPVALQLGGSEPDQMARAAEIGASFGYGEININVGCPSDRVQSGCFGAALMAEPKRVAEVFSAMQAAVDIPVTVKCRIGIDDQDSEADFSYFIETVAAAGCRTFIVHARKAWLSGLSPKENRNIPPLDHDRVHRLKRAMPELDIILNGGLESIDAAEGHLAHVDGVMLGRAAYQTPAILGEVDQRFFDFGAERTSRRAALEIYIPYVEEQLQRGTPLHAMTRHIFGLYAGEPGGRLFRRHLSEHASRPGAGVAVLQDAVGLVDEARAQRDARVAA